MKHLAMLFLIALISGCTIYYKPASDWEEKAMKEAKFNIFPRDVFSNINSHKSSNVAWAGIIKNYKIDNSTQPPQVVFTLEHHYFSWAIDGTTNKFWLSPRGEGIFTAKWPFQKDWTEDIAHKNIKNDDLMITYGTPKAITADNFIDLGEAFYMRLFPRDSYRTDVIDYGRPGEATKSLGLGL
jgi:hypothetical protein